MSRIGLRPIPVPAAVTGVTIDGQRVQIAGPKGELEYTVPAPLTVERRDEDGAIVVSRPDEERETRALHGLARTLINNMVVGVTDGYEKKLEIVGTGYRVIAKGSDLEFSLGYSHTILVKPPKGITFAVESPNKFSVSGYDKQMVGEQAAKIRKLRAPEPYKGKGIRYADETVIRKAGKAGK